LVAASVCPGVTVMNSTQFGGKKEFAELAVTELVPMA
jgi:hypothetical protein